MHFSVLFLKEIVYSGLRYVKEKKLNVFLPNKITLVHELGNPNKPRLHLLP